MVVFCHTSKICTCVPPSWTSLPLPSPFHPSGLSQSTGFGCPASCMELASVLHMVMYMFQCYSLKSSHPHLLPLSPKVCSLYLCLLCRPACRVIGYQLFFMNKYTKIFNKLWVNIIQQYIKIIPQYYNNYIIGIYSKSMRLVKYFKINQCNPLY